MYHITIFFHPRGQIKKARKGLMGAMNKVLFRQYGVRSFARFPYFQAGVRQVEEADHKYSLLQFGQFI